MRHETSSESSAGGSKREGERETGREREREAFLPQATSTPLALGVNVLGDADLSPVIYKRQCQAARGQPGKVLSPGRLLTIATQLSGNVAPAYSVEGGRETVVGVIKEKFSLFAV